METDMPSRPDPGSHGLFAAKSSTAFERPRSAATRWRISVSAPRVAYVCSETAAALRVKLVLTETTLEPFEQAELQVPPDPVALVASITRRGSSARKTSRRPRSAT
jgi:hypothetical protein